MSMHSNQTRKSDVVGYTRPRNRPRGDGWRGRPYYIGADHVHPLAIDQEENRPRRPTTSLADYGGKYRPAIGVSTRDVTDAEDMQERLADFNRELERCRRRER